MYTVLSATEKVFRGVRVCSKLAYYKLKYGRRLKVGKGVHFRKGFIINMSKNGKLTIGDGTWFNNYCSINCHEKITIGKNNLFGEGVRIYDHNHIINKRESNIKNEFKTRSVAIGDRNWIGSNVVILSKTRIGDDNVVGAGVILNGQYGSELIVKLNDNTKTSKRVFDEK